MPTPFDTVATVDFAPKGQQFAERLTERQRSTLRQMALEKAQLKGMDLEKADDIIDSWLADMSKECAIRATRKLGAQLDQLRREKGIPVGARGLR